MLNTDIESIRLQATIPNPGAEKLQASIKKFRSKREKQWVLK